MERKPLAATAFIPVAGDPNGGVARPQSGTSPLAQGLFCGIPDPMGAPHSRKAGMDGTSIPIRPAAPSGTKRDRGGALSAPVGRSARQIKTADGDSFSSMPGADSDPVLWLPQRGAAVKLVP